MKLNLSYLYELLAVINKNFQLRSNIAGFDVKIKNLDVKRTNILKLIEEERWIGKVTQ